MESMGIGLEGECKKGRTSENSFVSKERKYCSTSSACIVSPSASAAQAAAAGSGEVGCAASPALIQEEEAFSKNFDMRA